MPAGSALPHGELYVFAGLSRLSRRRNPWDPRFYLRNIDPRARLKILKRLMRQFAIALKLSGTEINVAARRIGISLFDKRADERDYRVDVFGSSRCCRRSGRAKPLSWVQNPLLYHDFGDRRCPPRWLFLISLSSISVNSERSGRIAAPLKIAAQHVNAETDGRFLYCMKL